MNRLSIPGYLCTHCDTQIGEPLTCPGCGWVDPLTKYPYNDTGALKPKGIEEPDERLGRD